MIKIMTFLHECKCSLLRYRERPLVNTFREEEPIIKAKYFIWEALLEDFYQVSISVN